MAISIGIIHGDAEIAYAPVGTTLRTLMKSFDERRDRSEPLVNIIFLTHGRLSSPSHEGARVVRYSRKENGIIVHVGVSDAIANTRRGMRTAILALVRESVRAAAIRFAAKNVEYDVERDLRSVDKLEAQFIADHFKN